MRSLILVSPRWREATADTVPLAVPRTTPVATQRSYGSRGVRLTATPWPTAVASGENYYLVWPKTRPGGERLRRLADFLQSEVQAMVLPAVERLD